VSQAAPTDDVNRPPIEIVNPNHPRGPFRAAILDFDGTLSLLRRNWQDVMIPLMVDILLATGTGESQSDLTDHVEHFVMQLNGRQTIYQMIQLVEEVNQRGGQPKSPLDYKREYHELLWREVSQRIEAVRSGQVSPDQMSVPGCRQLLDMLQRRSIELYLASGTDLNYVRDELSILQLASYFGTRVYGALDDYKRFSKAKIINRMIHDTGVAGHEILGFGDGFVEIEEVKKVGGLAIGVASDEVRRRGINEWKRERLMRAGADVIIGDYRCLDALLSTISLTDRRPT